MTNEKPSPAQVRAIKRTLDAEQAFGHASAVNANSQTLATMERKGLVVRTDPHAPFLLTELARELVMRH